jgi:excisionase family DNA binding protein
MDDALALRAGEAARLLRISTRFLAQLTREGKIPHKRVGRAILYPVEELREWLRRCPGPDVSKATHEVERSGGEATLDGGAATLDETAAHSTGANATHEVGK